jgi:hypothetical protein
MKVPFEITVMLFMILSGVMLITLSLGLSSPKIFASKKFKPVLWVMSSLLFLFLLLISIFVVEW